MSSSRLRLAIFDLAGTVVDYGCFAPTTAFTKLFANAKIQVSPLEIRQFMGLHKREHLNHLLALPSVQRQWFQQYKAYPGLTVETHLYQQFVPLQLEALDTESTVVTGTDKAFTFTRAQGIVIGSTTGYTKVMSDKVRSKLLTQGISFDMMVASDEVQRGRPHSDMILRQSELLDLRCLKEIVKVGDTPDDILEGKSVGCWTVGVLASSNGMGLREREFQDLSLSEKNVLLKREGERLKDADFLIRTVADLPQVIERINRYLQNGISPGSL